MKYIQSEKYNLAWFRLAECVSRGERERAMGVYRLLSHSLGNDALAAQLKGDLLLCFNDQLASKKYLEAANLYKKSQKTIEAIAVYEHLFLLEPDNQTYLSELISLYREIGMPFKIVDHVQELVKKNKLDMAIDITETIAASAKREDLAQLRKNIIFGLMALDPVPEEKIMDQIKCAVEELISMKDESLLQKFLSELKLLKSNYYKKACGYIAK